MKFYTPKSVKSVIEPHLKKKFKASIVRERQSYYLEALKELDGDLVLYPEFIYTGAIRNYFHYRKLFKGETLTESEYQHFVKEFAEMLATCVEGIEAKKETSESLILKDTVQGFHVRYYTDNGQLEIRNGDKYIWFIHNNMESWKEFAEQKINLLKEKGEL